MTISVKTHIVCIRPVKVDFNESLKKRAYESRLREAEHSSFTSLVFSATGGIGYEATVFYKKLASLLSDAWKEPYAAVLIDW